MHGGNSISALFVNAEVDSMGGVVDGGVGTGLKTSPHRAAIEKAQAELRQEYDVREERRRELEFLEKGGNPLDFKFGNASSVSVQSTSLTDHHHDLFLNSEAKCSVALTASPHGDSVDSSARPGAASVNEPNTADNLLLFEGENELPESGKRSLHLNKRKNVTRSEQSSRIDGSQNVKESDDSAIFRPYERRNRSRPNHASRGGSRDVKGLVPDKNNQKDHILPSDLKPKFASVNGSMVAKDPKTLLDNDLHGVRAHQTACGNSVTADKMNITLAINSKEDPHTVPSQDDTAQNPVVMDSGEANVVEEREPVASADLEVENETCSGQQNGFGNIKLDSNCLQNQGQSSCAAASGMKNFELDSCMQANLGRDVYSDSDMHANTKNVDANGTAMEQTLEFEKKQNLSGCEVVKGWNNTNNRGIVATDKNGPDADHQNHSGADNVVKAEEDKNNSRTLVQNQVNDSSNTIVGQRNDCTVLLGHLNSDRDNCCGRPEGPIDVSNSELPQAEKASTSTSGCQPCSSHHMILSNKAREDSILEEAQIIEAKRKRIAELSIRVLPTHSCQKSHWDFVLEEMAWLANDFAQERIWKAHAAAQLCHRAAFMSRLRFEEQNKNWGIKALAHTMAKAVMQFWHSVELLLDNADPGINCIDRRVESGKVDIDEDSSDKRNSYLMLETSKDLEGQHPRKSVTPKVQAYALRFLKYNSLHGISSQAVAPVTPERLSDLGTMDMSWEDHLTEETLFYTVPSNAMEAYRKSVESHFLQCEKTGTSIRGESETFMLDAITDFGPEEMAYEEEEGETGTCYSHGVYEGIKSSGSVQKKHRHMMKSHIPRSSEIGAEVPYGHYATGTQQSMLIGKRPASLNVGPIRKRVRTAPRQRVISPFMAGAIGAGQAQAKTDASSGDTNSFQDDQSTLHGGSQIQKSVEVDSGGDFERQFPYDCAETSFKTKKKKKAKNLGSAYDQGWQLDSVLNEQRDHYLKRFDSHNFESNGSSGLYGQHNAKKLKIMKQPPDNNLDNIAPMTGSIPSPAASQMSNMSNQSKFIRIISGRDRGRKAKALKISAGQPGLGSPWSLFEDQALVVLVHDMGPNWELVSDAINSALQFKCIFRKPKECKERHKILMDKSSGDGADSAEDSGSSQSYPSTLPGIPKGSARQLFQRLQGPMEEETLRSHFEKIIRIGQKLHYRRSQNENQDLKQMVNVHNSHVIALSQVCPNNLNGDILTPLDLCDSNSSTPDLGYQGSHAGGLALSNQSSVPPLPTSGVNSSLPGSSGMVLGGNLSVTSGSITASVRDSRFGVPRGSALSVDEQQRIQQYNPMLSGRNLQQSTMSVPGSLSGSDRGVRMLPGGNNMGMMGGMSRSAALSRPGFQGMASSSVLTPGSMHSSSMVGMPSPVNMHSGVGTGSGNSILRPREAIHMRPGHNPEHQRQMMAPELQIQVTQANSPAVAAFNGLSSAFCNQTTQPPIQPYTGHAQQPHQMSQQQSHLSNSHSHLQGPNHASSQHQAYAIRLAKERQLQQQQQQRYLQHQQQQFAASSAMMPQVQSQSQLPMSSALQNSSQVQAQSSSQQLSPVTPSSPLTPMSSHHQQQKHHLPQHGFSRNPGAGGLTNQSVKQRQRQPQQQQYQQSSRQHPNQRQNAQSQQHAKLLKGIGRGNLVHQNISVDPSHLNGLSMSPGSQTAEKGDSVIHLMQGQNPYPGSGVNPIQSPKPMVSAAHSSSYSQLPQKLHSGPAPTSKQQPMISPDSTQAQVLTVASGHMISLPQATVSPAVASSHSQMQLQSQPQSKQINQTQSNMQRMMQQNRQIHCESPSRSQSDLAQVDQQPTNSVPQISTSSGMTQGCADTANVVPAFPTVSPQWKISEPPYDSNMPNPVTQVGSLGSAPVGKSAGNETFPAISQGLSPKQISVSLPSHAHNSGAQWPHQPTLPLQQSLSQPILSQQPYQSQEQQQERGQHSPKRGALQHQPQQQVHHLQPGQGVLFTSPTHPSSTAE